MKQMAIVRFSQWFILFGILGAAGCSTTSDESGAGVSRTIKTRGVYTTIAVRGRPLDMSGSEYMSCRTFSPGQTPAAVVTGYGDYVGDINYAEAFELRLVESASGTVLQTFKTQIYAGRAEVVDLPIRKSGNYQLQLLIQGSVADTWDFVVKREVSADTDPIGGQSPPYAKGNFSAGMENYQSIDEFMQYDDALLYALNVAVYKEFKNANRDDFAQMPAGHVVIQFDLSATGQVASPQIVENSLSNTIGRFFLHALQNGAPYKPWPAAARAALGTETRHMKVTFHYD